MERIGGDGRGTPNRRRATDPVGDNDGNGGKKKCRMVELELEIFHNPELRAYPGWKQQPQPWSTATALKYVGFPTSIACSQLVHMNNIANPKMQNSCILRMWMQSGSF